MFDPSRTAAKEALRVFLPNAGPEYTANRNFDHGQSRHDNVSTLSPWIRTRALTEWEVVSAVLEEHSETAASKFIDEICWRTYWKGWLQLRPSVWADYVQARTQLLEEYAEHIGYRKAVDGQTGIDCFDAWATELTETGYLHNHARMWAASIWIHTLKLPWELGADWFLRHLLDGDAAANTLSWRWVAGLQTRGKSYLATAGNIQKYTSGRFPVSERLATEPVSLPENPPPPIRPLTQLPEPSPKGKIGLLLTEEDLSAADWLPERYPLDAIAGVFPTAGYAELGIEKNVVDFRRSCLGERTGGNLFESIDNFVAWCRQEELQTVILAEPPVGIWSPLMSQLSKSLTAEGIELRPQRHWWDEVFYPNATHGFFRFKKAIPKILQRLNQKALETHDA